MYKRLKKYALVWQMIFFITLGFYQEMAFGRGIPCGCPNAEDSLILARMNNRLSETKGAEQVKLLIQRGEIYQSAGHYGEAMADFVKARELIDGLADGQPEKNQAGNQRENQADGPPQNINHHLLTLIADQALGYLFFLKGDHALAEKRLRSVLTSARSLDMPLVLASSTHALARVLSSMDRGEEAYLLYQEALEYAEKGDDKGMEAGILRNLAHILPDNARAVEKLTQAWNLAQKIKPCSAKIDLLLGIGAEARQRGTKAGTFLSFDALKEALALAQDQASIRRQSQALGGLAQLYESLGQLDDAEKMNGQALEKAQALQAHDLLINLEWQMGRLLRAKGEQNKAVQAYRRAVYHIQAIRHDIPAGNQEGAACFRSNIALIHQGLADLLLELASRETTEADRQDLLREAQKVVEGIKLSELRDYFRDPCLAALSRGIENLAPGTAVFYPIMLPDRLELMVEVNGQLICKTSPIQRDRLEGEILELAHTLRKGLPFKEQTQHVYDWLVRPVIALLEAHDVKTLVNVPDGVLRLIPMAALMDGDHFLVERYSLVTVPGLTLLDPAPLGRYQKKTLLAGVSDPGPVIFELPRNYWNTLRVRGGSGVERAIRGLSLETVISDTSNGSGVEVQQDSKNASEENSEKQEKASGEDANMVRQALALPGVKKEIESMAESMAGKVMFNKDFELDSFCSELQAGNYNIVHIASHGFFGGSPERNFIMTFDKRLDMNLLEMLIRPKQLADKPVEIVSLSACQTAEGDDRSPLGLSGVVLKSGARSALGSLWPVSDQAAQELFPAFYALLDDPQGSVSKAQALRLAQLKLMGQDCFRHPFYWSAFILVGSWL